MIGKVKRLFPAIFLFLFVIILFRQYIISDSILSFRDLFRYYYPIKHFVVNSMKAGVLPLWNPYICSGMPNLALQQSAFFYPLSVIYYILPFNYAFNIFIVFHIFLAALFMYLLMRRWGLGVSGSLVAALSFMMCGYISSVPNLLTTLCSVVWLPLVLLFLDRALEGGSAADISITSILVLFMYLGGEPSIFYSSIIVLFFYSLFHAGARLGNLKNSLKIFIIIVSLGTLLGAFQIMPFLELVGHTDRMAMLSQETHQWSLKLRDTADFILPHLFRIRVGVKAYFEEQNWAALLYAGVAALVLLVIGISLKRDRRKWFLLFSGIFFLAVAYGHNTPVYPALCRIMPFFKFARYPVRFLYVTSFSIAALAGMGFDAYLKVNLSEGAMRRRLFRVLASFLIAALIILAAIHIFNPYITSLFLKWAGKSFSGGARWDALQVFLNGIHNINRLIYIVLAVSAILLVGTMRRVSGRTVSAVLIAIVIFDFSTAVDFYQFTVSKDIFRRTTPVLKALKEDKALFRIFQSPKLAGSPCFLEGPSYENAVLKSIDKLLANWGVLYGIYDARGYESMYLDNYKKLVNLASSRSSPGDSKILDMLNVKYVISPDRLKDRNYELVTKGMGDYYLSRNLNVMDRAYLAKDFKVIKDEQAIAAKFKSKDFDPAREVILEEEPVLKGQGARVKGQGLEKIEIRKYSPNEVLIDTVVNSPKFLVLADQYYPGWKAYVDGRREHLYKANFVLRAVRLEPGRHEVRFLFDPFTFKLGAAISITTFFVMLGIVIAGKRWYTLIHGFWNRKDI